MNQSRKTFIKRFKKNSYIYISQIILALIIIFDYSLSRENINHIFGNWFYLLPLSGLTLGFLPTFKNWDLYKHKVLALGVGYFLVGLFLILLTDIFGPYFQILILILFLAIYWLGWYGFTLAMALQSIIILVGSWYQFTNLSDDLIYLMIIHISTLGLLGLIFERVSYRHHQKNRSDPELLQTVSFERTRLLSLINSMADAVIATDEKGVILLYNGAVLDLLNTNISLENKKITDFLKLKNAVNRNVNIIDEAKKANRALKRDDLHFISNEKQKIDLYIDIAPIRSGQYNRQQAGYIMLLRDITKEKSLDEERTEFISVTSHELRTPIAIAEANISTSLLPNMSKGMKNETKELLGHAHNQIVFLGDLVNDLTTLARAERGDLSLDIQPIEPTTLLKKLAEEYAPEASEEGLKVAVDNKTTSKSVNNSELYVKEILQNFITNAIKYTEKGGITLGAKSKGKQVIFSVNDTGIGISSSDKKRIFSKFYRAEDYRTRKTRGTGLGLYITKKLVEKIKGKIWFDSKLNEGSTFYLQVPSLQHKSTKKR